MMKAVDLDEEMQIRKFATEEIEESSMGIVPFASSSSGMFNSFSYSITTRISL